MTSGSRTPESDPADGPAAAGSSRPGAPASPGPALLAGLAVDPSLPSPVFEQIRDHVLAARAAGTLAAGDRLPPVRALAAELGVAVNTVAKSYRELETAGVIETRGRHGSFLRDAEDSRQRVAQAASAFARFAREQGTDPAEALELVRRALEQPRPS